MYVFGPVPSRRLGYSLGINHIPPKHCSYSCVYCQLGRTTNCAIRRENFYPLDALLDQVRQAIAESASQGQTIDYLSLVPDGEPALDLNLGDLIRELKTFRIPVAVISNSSLLTSVDVQEALHEADWVSLKVDSVISEDWEKIDRPYRQLDLKSILEAILKFRKKYSGILVTETMLVSGLNDQAQSIHELSSFLHELQPLCAYLSLPIRPPAENWVKPPTQSALRSIMRRLLQTNPFVIPLFEHEGNDFVSSGDLRENILSITAVHPIRETALRKLVHQSDADWAIVENLLEKQELTETPYAGEVFYRKNLRKKISRQVSNHS